MVGVIGMKGGWGSGKGEGEKKVVQAAGEPMPGFGGFAVFRLAGSFIIFFLFFQDMEMDIQEINLSEEDINEIFRELFGGGQSPNPEVQDVPNAELAMDMGEFLDFQGEGELWQVPAPEEEQVAAPPEPNNEVDIDMTEFLYFRGEGELGPVAAEEGQVAAPEEEQVAAPEEEHVAARQEEQVAAPEEEQVAAPEEEQVAAPQEEQVAAQEEVVKQPQPLQEMPECWVVLQQVAHRPVVTRDERRLINEGAWNEEETALVKEIQKNYDLFYERNIGGKKGHGHCDMVRPTFDIATRSHKQCYRKAKQLLNKEKSVMLRKLGLSDTCARYYYREAKEGACISIIFVRSGKDK